MNPLPTRTAALEERPFRLELEHDPLRTIRGRIVHPRDAAQRAEPLGYVLVLHGFKGFMDWGFFPELTRRLAARGLAAVRFNFSGSGIGEDPLEFTEERAFFENTPSRELEDVERVRDWLDSGAVPWIDARRGALVGHSLGGAVALIHAARRGDYRALVGWSSVASFRRSPPDVEALWRRRGFVEIPNVRTKQVHRLGRGWLDDIERNGDVLDVPAACRRLRTPTLLVHGSEDESVPLPEGRALFESFAAGVARLEVIEGADHTFRARHPLSDVPPALERAFSTSADLVADALAGPRRTSGS